ncbi:type IV toxin-antitoxin system AbiEi family antitoxin domain-containing protein [Lactococcus ileimucosae]|uniref:type IV toxin-antitoxin system AbiEi family antitoxin domain-containing protein n=1 Tax=Lactococcus ileimucosae TaxID=2941329 RepID=UPI00351224DE
MRYDNQINHLLTKQSIIQSSDFVAEGIPTIYLSRLAAKGHLKQVGRGLYISDWSQYDEFAIFQLQHKKAIYSYLSALYLHGLTDVLPQYLEVTVYGGYNTHRFPDEVKVHFTKKEFYSLGKTAVTTTFGNEVWVYDMERTICDLIANRSKLEAELFTKALQAYMGRTDKELTKLYRYASSMGIGQKVTELIEVLHE